MRHAAQPQDASSRRVIAKEARPKWQTMARRHAVGRIQPLIRRYRYKREGGGVAKTTSQSKLYLKRRYGASHGPHESIAAAGVMQCFPVAKAEPRWPPSYPQGVK